MNDWSGHVQWKFFLPSLSKWAKLGKTLSLSLYIYISMCLSLLFSNRKNWKLISSKFNNQNRAIPLFPNILSLPRTPSAITTPLQTTEKTNILVYVRHLYHSKCQSFSERKVIKHFFPLHKTDRRNKCALTPCVSSLVASLILIFDSIS